MLAGSSAGITTNEGGKRAMIQAHGATKRQHALADLDLKGLPQDRIRDFRSFMSRIETELLPHPIIVHNAYTEWFLKGDFSPEQLRHFLIQFSVFSNLFLEAQLKKVINAPTLEAMRSSKEILMNELGVVFKGGDRGTAGIKEGPSEVDPELVGTNGTVEGSHFRFAAAHIEWLLRMTEQVGVKFSEMGKRKFATPSTRFFCDELSRLYGSEDPSTALGASFAVENWAAAGFWKQLIQGLRVYQKQHQPDLKLAFFLWHDKVEDQHAEHTFIELQEEYFESEVNEERFFVGGKEMLEGVRAFWDGLDKDRRRSAP